MSALKVGNVVRVTRGEHAGQDGTVVVAHPRAVVVSPNIEHDDDGRPMPTFPRRAFLIDDVELVPDPVLPDVAEVGPCRYTPEQVALRRALWAAVCPTPAEVPA